MKLGQKFVKYFIQFLDNGVSKKMLLRFTNRFLLTSRSSKNRYCIFQLLNHLEINLKPQFLIKSGFYCAPSHITALRKRPNKSAGATLLPGQKQPRLRPFLPLKEGGKHYSIDSQQPVEPGDLHLTAVVSILGSTKIIRQLPKCGRI